MKRLVNLGWIIGPGVLFLSLYYSLMIFFSSATHRNNLEVGKKITSKVKVVKTTVVDFKTSFTKMVFTRNKKEDKENVLPVRELHHEDDELYKVKRNDESPHFNSLENKVDPIRELAFRKNSLTRDLDLDDEDEN
jgi:hypothetical protein